MISHPKEHATDIRKALQSGCHVLVELPVALTEEESKELYDLAKENNVVLMPSIKTAYATAYNRMILLVKAGKIGKVVSIDATCTSIREIDVGADNYSGIWNSICAWGPTAMLPIFHILGTDYRKANIASFFLDEKNLFDRFTKVDFIYENAVASLKVGRGVKSEGELIISGTEGYIYVPAPWWKTDYFELRFENLEDNQKYFYQLDGEGIRYELVAFAKSIELGKNNTYIDFEVSKAICKIMEDFENRDLNLINKY